MCRLFGFRSSVPSRAHRSLVEAKNALALQAEQHQDGWGIGYFLGEEAYTLKSDAGAAEDERFQRVSERLHSHTFVVHVRRATVGPIDHFNSHPFRYGAWIFAHNGTIWDFDKIADVIQEHTHPDLRPLVFGTTDSESFFYYLLSALNEAGISMDGREEVNQQVATQALRDAVDRLYGWAEERGIDAPIANYILTNGSIFFAQRAGLDLHMATQKLSCRDFHVCAEPNKVCMDVAPALQVPQGDASPEQTRPVNHLLVSSEPIGGEDIWEEVPQGAMVVMGTDFRVSLQAGPPRFRVSPRMPLGRNPDARSVTSA